MDDEPQSQLFPACGGIATLQVCLTFELAQAILQFLTVEDLIIVQRVCKLWHSVIQETPRLQELMFLQPAHVSMPTGPHNFTTNPLLKARFPGYFESLLDEEEFHMRENMLLIKYDKPQGVYLNANASWRRMLIVQPLVQTVEIQEEISGVDTISKQTGYVVEPEAALRMGWINDVCWNSTTGKNASFAIHLDMFRRSHWKPQLTIRLRYYGPLHGNGNYNPWIEQDHKNAIPTEVVWDRIIELDA